MAEVRRKRKRTFNDPGHAHFLTFSCYRRWPLLSKDRSRQWLIDAIDGSRNKFDFDVWAYVIMPEHVHLLIWPRQPEYSLPTILAAIKRPVSRLAKEHLTATRNSEWLEKLTVHRGQRDVFRFWQQGGGFDENLWNDRPIENVIDYIHANPVRRGLVQRSTDWFWSSARSYSGIGEGPLRIDSVKW